MSGLASLRATGEALFGAEWQMPLARLLNVDGRTMRFWTAADRPVPDHVVVRLPSILRDTATERRRSALDLEKLANELANCMSTLK